MITIRKISKKELYDYIYSEEYANLEFVPISRQRALSHINNPRAKDDDILLFLAYWDEQLVGYLGVLADTLFYDDKVEHGGWLSCFWINENFRGKQIAFQLLDFCIQTWNKKVLITEFTGPAKKLYDKSENFTSLALKQGIRLYVRSDLSKLLAPKHNIFKKGKPLLNLADFLFNFIFDFRLHFYPNKLNGLHLEYVNHVDKETDDFIKERQGKQLFRRRANELNWIIHNPWILMAPAKDQYSSRYYFSAVDKSFDFVPVKIYNSSGLLIAFLIFAKRNDDLKLPYCYFSADVNPVIDVINYHLVKWRIKTFTTYNTAIVPALIKKGSPALFKKKVVREYQIGTIFDLEHADKDFEIQDGDADCSFT